MRRKRTITHPATPARALPKGVLITPPMSEDNPRGLDQLRRKLIRGGHTGWTRSELLRGTRMTAEELDWGLRTLIGRGEAEAVEYAAGPRAYRCTPKTLNRPPAKPGKPKRLTYEDGDSRSRASFYRHVRGGRELNPGTYAPDSDCWFWVGELDDWGEPVTPDGRDPHLVAWEYDVAPLGTRQELQRRCRDEGCINPSHKNLINR